MKKDIALLIANVLETGCFQQCRGRNQKDGAFCITGVVVEIFLEMHPGFEFEIKNDYGLPNEVMAWGNIYNSGMALRSSDPDAKIELRGENHSWFFSLRGANDDGVTFLTLSEWLRKNYELI